MQRLVFVRYTVKPDQAAENEALSRAVFKELRRTEPQGLTYTLFRKDTDFVHFFVNLHAADSESLVGLPSFKAFSKDVSGRAAGPIEQIRLDLDLVDSYGLHAAELAETQPR
jgi:quinol monooxygenase YgiN